MIKYTIYGTGETIYYIFNWGDGTDSGWLGPFDSGETVNATHSWEEEGSYEIKVQAKDTGGLLSDWSDPLPISMPLNKESRGLFLLILERLMERFPFLELLLSLPVFDSLLISQ